MYEVVRPNSQNVVRGLAAPHRPSGFIARLRQQNKSRVKSLLNLTFPPSRLRRPCHIRFNKITHIHLSLFLGSRLFFAHDIFTMGF
jgi:hypothetical protein